MRRVFDSKSVDGVTRTERMEGDMFDWNPDIAEAVASPQWLSETPTTPSGSSSLVP
jgi:hypothetical protein